MRRSGTGLPLKHDLQPATCFDTFCSGDHWPRHSCPDLRRFRARVAARRRLSARPNRSRVWFGNPDAFGWLRAAFQILCLFIGSRPIPIPNRLAPVEGARSSRGAADGGRLARLRRTCRASGRRLGSICQTGQVTGWIDSNVRGRRKRHPPGADSLCGFPHTNRAFTSRVCEADGRTGTSVASFPNWLGLPDRRRTDRGVAVLFSPYPRMTATVEAAMLSLFTLLVWGPAILAAPRTRLPWTAFFISWAITAAAWLVASNIPANKSAKRED